MTWWMIGLGILWGVLFLPTIALPIMSVMVFDSGKDKTAATKLFAFSMALARFRCSPVASGRCFSVSAGSRLTVTGAKSSRFCPWLISA
jgi:hypothetical protein